MFCTCDRFNRQLHDRKFPHRSGGRATTGEVSVQHNFAMSCVLQNSFNAYVEIMGDEGEKYDFKTFCTWLAKDVYRQSGTL